MLHPSYCTLTVLPPNLSEVVFCRLLSYLPLSLVPEWSFLNESSYLLLHWLLYSTLLNIFQFKVPATWITGHGGWAPQNTYPLTWLSFLIMAEIWCSCVSNSVSPLISSIQTSKQLSSILQKHSPVPFFHNINILNQSWSHNLNWRLYISYAKYLPEFPPSQILSIYSKTSLDEHL